MEHGDLATSTRPQMVVVLEGVLANVTPIEARQRWSPLPRRTPEITGWNFHWLDVPVKRLAWLTRNFDVSIEVVTFLSADVADQAAEFFHDIGLAIERVSYQRFDRWTPTLRFQEIHQIIDSDQDRLDRYGQLGRAVVKGEDF